MPDGQSKLIAAVAAAAKSPVIVVTITASALELASVLGNSKVGAVLHAGEPADSSLGIADIIFGKRVPAGRMIREKCLQDHTLVLQYFHILISPASYTGCELRRNHLSGRLAEYNFNSGHESSAWTFRFSAARLSETFERRPAVSERNKFGENTPILHW